MQCICCGKGVVEIKWPFSCRDKSFFEAVGEKVFCMELIGNAYHLKKSHTYYYQVQAQMKFRNALYCDFVVWTENDLIIERLLPDDEFMKFAIEKATEFFKYLILLKLLGKHYTKLSSIPLNVESADQEESSKEPVWHYCRKEEDGEMNQCESGRYKIIWFHTACLRIKSIPKGKWICPECKKEAAIQCRKIADLSKKL